MDLSSLAAAQPRNVFPKLSKREILDCLADMELSLEVDELNEPHRFKEKMKSLFQSFVQRGLCKDAAYFTTIPSGAIEKKKEWYPYCEVRDDVYTTIKFIVDSKDFMTICGLGHDFGLRDLYSPAHVRLKHQLSAVINYFKFEAGKLGNFHEQMEEQDKIFQELDQLMEENQTISTQYDAATKQVEIRLQEQQGLESQCQVLETDIIQKNKLQASMRQDSIVLKKRANELKDENALLTLKIQELAAEERKLNTQIVSSPEKIQYRMNQVQKTLEEERLECTKQEQQAAMSKVILSKVSKAVQDGNAVTKLVETDMEEQTKYRQALGSIENTERGILNNDRECQSMKEMTDWGEQEIRILEDKVHHNRKQFKMKMDAMQHSMEAANAELFLVEKDRRDGLARIEAMKQEVRSLEAMIAEEEEKNDAEMEEYLETFHRFAMQVMKSDNMFLAALHEK